MADLDLFDPGSGIRDKHPGSATLNAHRLFIAIHLLAIEI
jgi:hypothetical protein